MSNHYYVANRYGRNIDLKALDLPPDVVNAFMLINGVISSKYSYGLERLSPELATIAEELSLPLRPAQ